MEFHSIMKMIRLIIMNALCVILKPMDIRLNDCADLEGCESPADGSTSLLEPQKQKIKSRAGNIQRKCKGYRPGTSTMETVILLVLFAQLISLAEPGHLGPLMIFTPGAPTNLTSTRITDSSVKLQWEWPKVNRGVITKFVIFSNKNIRYQFPAKNTDNGHVNAYTITKLLSSTEYEFYMIACSYKECSRRSNSLTVTTESTDKSACSFKECSRRSNSLNVTTESTDKSACSFKECSRRSNSLNVTTESTDKSSHVMLIVFCTGWVLAIVCIIAEICAMSSPSWICCFLREEDPSASDLPPSYSEIALQNLQVSAPQEEEEVTSNTK